MNDYISLKNFRCFDSIKLDLSKDIVVVSGSNGSGKTSLLEGLHYLCYARSFRTSSQKEIVAFDNNEFMIKANICDSEILIRVLGSTKHVKINGKSITSILDLQNYYQAITLTEDDIEIIKESPLNRRIFFDYALMMHDFSIIETFKKLKHAIESRNALLKYGFDETIFNIWTEKVFEYSKIIQIKRLEMIAQLKEKIDTLILNHAILQNSITFEYQSKNYKVEESFLNFNESNLLKSIYTQERSFKRSLFGAHLDDVLISFDGKLARLYSSRGQQKKIIFLLKAALCLLLKEKHKEKTLYFLLDDFMTDFDKKVFEDLMKIALTLNVKLIFTSPFSNNNEIEFLKSNNLDFFDFSI